jgi:hypothetical protein
MASELRTLEKLMPRKTFTDGEPLSAYELNTFLMNQAVQTYPGTASRDTELPTPLPGQVTTDEFNKNLQTYYDEWRPLPFAIEQSSVSVTTATANVVAGVAVTFAVNRFSTAPYVFTTAFSTASNTINTQAGGVTDTGATIYALRNATGTTTVRWMAIQMTDGGAAG